MIGNSTYLERKIVDDTANSASPANIDLQVMKLKNKYVSLNGNITLNFSSTSKVALTNSLALVFPSEYGNLRTIDLACTLTPIVTVGVAAAEKIQYPKCTSTAKTIIAPLTLDLDKDTSYQLDIQGVIGPEFENCMSRKPTFGIIDDKTIFTHLSAENAINMASPAYTSSSDIIYVAYYKNDK